MAEVKSLFREYLTAIEPDAKAKRLAAKSHELPRDYLQEDTEIGEYVQDSFLYGSYRRHTATHDIKDVDIMLLTTYDPDDTTPQKALADLYAALKRCYGDDNVLKKNRRSIQVLNPLPDEKTDLTLDVLPSVEVNDGSGYLLVPDKDEKEWILTNPRGHIDAISKVNDEQDKTLVPMVKIMKAWWKYQSESLATQSNPRPRPKSFWLETLVLNYFENAHDNWANRFVDLLDSIASSFPEGSSLPILPDPGMPDTDLKTSMTIEEFRVFMSKVRESLITAREALEEPDRSRSSELWSSVFGEDFPIEKSSEKSKYLAGQQYILGDWSHAKNLNLPFVKHGDVEIRAELYRRNLDNKRLKVRLGSIPNNSSLRNGLHIRFHAKPSFKLDQPYDVYWRVVNTGGHAARVNGLRGAPFVDHTGSELVRWESTDYTGKHWLDCFIVCGGKIVAASDKFYVNVSNPKWA